MLETVDELVTFFEEQLFDPALVRGVAIEAGVPLTVDDVRRHVGVCYDACHMAVGFETPPEPVGRLQAAGIAILKIQISSALRLRFRTGDGQAAAKLGAFAEDTYLHQVVERAPGGLTRYTDLPEALAVEAGVSPSSQAGEPREWRVHFHVPVFLETMRGFDTTQDHLVSLLALLKRDPVCPHLEVETYTWDVLPPEYRTEDAAAAARSRRDAHWGVPAARPAAAAIVSRARPVCADDSHTPPCGPRPCPSSCAAPGPAPRRNSARRSRHTRPSSRCGDTPCRRRPRPRRPQPATPPPPARRP